MGAYFTLNPAGSEEIAYCLGGLGAIGGGIRVDKFAGLGAIGGLAFAFCISATNAGGFF